MREAVLFYNKERVRKLKDYEKKLLEIFGKKLHYYDEIDSTNNVAKSMKDWTHGTIIIAKTQTAGRGTYGRTFYSNAGEGIYMTLIIDTDKWHFKDSNLTTHLAAVATSLAIVETTNISPEIKWVNDLFVAGKKIGGILTEKSFQTNKLIMGIGINVGETVHFPEEIKKTAASLALKAPLEEKMIMIIKGIYDYILAPSLLTNPQTVLQQYKEKLFILNETVEVVQGQKTFDGKVIDMDQQGRLIVKTNDHHQSLEVGEVRIKI